MQAYTRPMGKGRLALVAVCALFGSGTSGAASPSSPPSQGERPREGRNRELAQRSGARREGRRGHALSEPADRDLPRTPPSRCCTLRLPRRARPDARAPSGRAARRRPTHQPGSPRGLDARDPSSPRSSRSRDRRSTRLAVRGHPVRGAGLARRAVRDRLPRVAPGSEHQGDDRRRWLRSGPLRVPAALIPSRATWPRRRRRRSARRSALRRSHPTCRARRAPRSRGRRGSR